MLSLYFVYPLNFLIRYFKYLVYLVLSVFSIFCISFFCISYFWYFVLSLFIYFIYYFFIITVIFNFDHVSLFGNFCHFLRTCSSHWVSATQESLVGHKKCFFFTNSFIPLSHWLILTNKFQRNGNKSQKRRHN